jgi:small subunit ribosomal protein S13
LAQLVSSKLNSVFFGGASFETTKSENKSNDRIATPILSSLDTFNSANIKMLINSGTLRGKRIKLGFPVRGQRTRSNGKTAKRLNRGLDY